MSPQSRPLSPHLQVYRPMYTMVLSISHRASGVFQSVGMLLLAYWLVAAASGADEVYAAMGMRMTRSASLQTELQGEVLLRDQQRTVVTFSDHRLGAFAIDQESFKKSLRRRLLEEIAVRAMQRIMGLRTQREALEEEKTRLQWKLKMYQKQSDGIGGLWHDQGRLERHIQGLVQPVVLTRTGQDPPRRGAARIGYGIPAHGGRWSHRDPAGACGKDVPGGVGNGEHLGAEDPVLLCGFPEIVDVLGRHPTEDGGQFVRRLEPPPGEADRLIALG